MTPLLAFGLSLLVVADPRVREQERAQAFTDAEYVTPQEFLGRLKEVMVAIHAPSSTTQYVPESELEADVAAALGVYGITVQPSSPVRLDVGIVENVTGFTWNDDPDDSQDVHDIVMILEFTTRGVVRRGTQLLPMVAKPVEVARVTSVFQNNSWRTAFFGDETQADMQAAMPTLLEALLADVASNGARDTTPWYPEGWTDAQKAEANARFPALMNAPIAGEDHFAGLDVMPTMTSNSGGTSQRDGRVMPPSYLDEWRSAFTDLGWTRTSAEAPLYFDHSFTCDGMEYINTPHYTRIWNSITLRETNFVFVLNGRIVRKPAVICSWHNLMAADTDEDMEQAVDAVFENVEWDMEDLRVPVKKTPEPPPEADTSQAGGD